MNIKHLVIASLAAFATTARWPPMRRTLNVRNVCALLKDLPIEKVVPSDHAALYEIFTPQGIFYTDKAGSSVIFGASMIDTKMQVKLT